MIARRDFDFVERTGASYIEPMVGSVIVVMGPSGCGKSTLASALARDLELPFVEGDDLHPPANRALMASGVALTDDDRRPWLDAVADIAGREVTASGGAVVACSALRRIYRDQLTRRIQAPVLFVMLDADRDVLAERMASREGHYMPRSLLDSQIATLEPPEADEIALRLSAAAPVTVLVAAVRGWLMRE